MLNPPRTFNRLLSETPTSAPAPSVDSRTSTPIKPASPRFVCRGACWSEESLRVAISPGVDAESRVTVLASAFLVLSSAPAKDVAGTTIRRPHRSNVFLLFSVFCNVRLLLGFELSSQCFDAAACGPSRSGGIQSRSIALEDQIRKSAPGYY